MKKRFYQLGKKVAILSTIVICALLAVNQTFAQGVSINATGTGTAPDGSAILDLNITTKGFLVPRMTQGQRNAIASPANSLLIYQTDNTPGFYYNSGTPGTPVWTAFGGGSGPTAGNDINVTGTQVDVQPVLNYVNTITSTDGGGTGVASDLAILGPAFQNLILGAGGLEYGRFSSTSPGLFILGLPSTTTGTLRFGHSGSANTVSIASGATTTSYSLTLPLAQGAAGQTMINNGSGVLAWGTPTISGNAALTNGTIWIGNGSNVATEQTMSGDVTMTNAGVTTIQNNAVDGTDIALGSDATGDMMYYSAGGDYVRLPIGGANNVLGISGGVPGWGTVASFIGTDVENDGLTVAFPDIDANIGNGLSLNGTDIIGLTNGTAAGQTYVTGNSPFTPALVTMGGDATIGITGTLDLSNNAVTFDEMQDITGPAVIGKPGVGAGDPTTITATANKQVLRYDGTNIAFGIAPVTDFSATAWRTFYSNASGVITELVLGANGQVLTSGGPAAVPTWTTPLINPMDQVGDIIIGGASGALTQFNPAAGILHNTAGGVISWAPVNMAGGATEVSGVLPVVNGGTGVANPTANGILVGNGSSPVTSLTGTNMQTLRFNATPAPVASSNLLNNDVTIGIGGLTTAEVTASTAKLDIDGDNGSTLSLRLRSGNPNVGSGATQIAFGYAGTSNYEHMIKTRHASGSTVANAMEFWLSLSGGPAVRTAFFDGQGGLSLNSETTSFSTRIVPTAGQTQDYTIKLPNTVSAAGQGLVATDANGTLAWTTVGSGSVTNIATGTGLTGGPITTTGTISMANMAALSVKGNATNAVAAPTDIAAASDFQVLRRSGTAIGFGSINLASTNAVTGTLPVGNGGTGATTLTGMLQGNGTGAITAVTGTTNYVARWTSANTIGIGLIRDDGATVGINQVPNASYMFSVNGKVKSTGINETSDERLKMNFASIDGALGKVLSMNGKYYDWRTTEYPQMNLTEGRQVGVIAQEIEKILPEVVTTGDDGYKAVEYGHIVPVLIEAIKEQQKIIDGQSTTITDLKASLENVLNKLNIIEKNTDLNSSKVQK